MSGSVILAKRTDTSLLAILKHIEHQLVRGDIVTLTRGQWQTLKVELDKAKETGHG